jgi:Ca2+-binding EF-hand superfamily protein
MAGDTVKTPAAIWAGRDIFDLFDSNGNGRLCADELLLGLALMAQPVTKADIDFLIDLTDSDGDRLISREEFDRLRKRAPAPFYGGELAFATFGGPVIDLGSLSDYLSHRRMTFSSAQVTAFLRNINPDGHPVLSRDLYEAFVRAYRDA